jgi:pimeloyl-ACP methyl ester carboxylesterase
MLKTATTVCALALLVACQSPLKLGAYSSGKLQPVTLPTANFALQALAPPNGVYPHLRVYIEGDGHAWATASQPSTDPTPYTSLMLALAAQDAAPVAYLARPCQFIQGPACNAAVWTRSRFAEPEIRAMDAALSALKQRYGVQRFELVGHSGGGAVALVLAGMREDVDQVQTLAGNVDPAFWADLHHLTPLAQPMLPLHYTRRLAGIPQRHFVGLNDPVMPMAVAQAYRAALQGRCVEIVSVAATHGQGYEPLWARMAGQPIDCQQP